MPRTRIAVVGATGRTGSLVSEVVSGSDVSELAVAVGSSDTEGERTVEGVRVVGPDDAREAFEENDVDAVIDFSTPEGTEVAARSAAAVGAVLITGTTALDTDAEEAVDAAADEVPVLRSSNFAKGVNVFWEVVEEAARLLPEADFEITETHHRHKRDAPSGTALTAVERIEEAVGERDRVHGREGDSKRGDEIGVHARRGGDIPGEHEVLIASEDESLMLQHTSYDRRVFASGAHEAALWGVGREPGRYGMRDVLGIGEDE